MFVPELALDREKNEKLLVIEELDEEINNFVVTYDHNKNEKTVGDFNEDYNPNQKVIKAIYLNSLKSDWPFDMTQEELENEAKPYYFPEKRLKFTPTII